MDTHAQKMNTSKSFTFPQNIECEEPPSLSGNDGIFRPLSGWPSKFLTHPHLSTTPYFWVENDKPLMKMRWMLLVADGLRCEILLIHFS